MVPLSFAKGPSSLLPGYISLVSKVGGDEGMDWTLRWLLIRRGFLAGIFPGIGENRCWSAVGSGDGGLDEITEGWR